LSAQEAKEYGLVDNVIEHQERKKPDDAPREE
jgi:ATP-dependent protease ClpP protease subunit